MPSASANMDVPVEQSDILIIGAGLSGLNTAHVLREQLPHRSFDILEGRSVIGGTWSFFQYPGFRSDSYMTSFGLKWFPYTKHHSKIASAAEITSYLEEAAEADGTMENIRFRHKVNSVEWRSEEQKWTLDVDAGGTRKLFEANFIIACTGYYSYGQALEAIIPGIEDFGGQVVHPQWWPQDLDYADKRMVVIGSGATAVTIIPSLAKTASHVTMLQRSPSYVVAMPTTSKLESLMRIFMPANWVARFSWWKDTFYEVVATQFLLRYPNVGRRALTKMAKKQLPKDIDVDVHFNPSYNPFQQRLCMCPDGDFFKALHRDNCDIMTDVIKTVTKDGIELNSGAKIPADIIVTATGLYFEVFGGLTPICDGKPIEAGEHFTWRGCMLDSLPNMAFIMGYVTQSWTPGADAMAKTIVRVIKEMEKKGQGTVMPVMDHSKKVSPKLAVDASSNYFLKAADRIPKVTGETPWYGRQNLVVDLWSQWFGSMEDGLEYRGGPKEDKKMK